MLCTLYIYTRYAIYYIEYAIMFGSVGPESSNDPADRLRTLVLLEALHVGVEAAVVEP